MRPSLVPVFNCDYLFNNSLPLWIYLSLCVIILLVSMALLRKMINTSFFGYVGLFLIFLGGMGNLVERGTTGCVKDYLDFMGMVHFNVNDVLVSFGIAVLIVVIVYDKTNNNISG